MEYLSGLVANYSITVPFALKKLGEQNLSPDEVKKMDDFIKLQKFCLEYQDITDQWESMEALVEYPHDRADTPIVMIFFNTEELHRSITLDDNLEFPIIGIVFKRSLKQFMLDHKNDIYKVFLYTEHWGYWINDEVVKEVRTRMLASKPKN